MMVLTLNRSPKDVELTCVFGNLTVKSRSIMARLAEKVPGWSPCRSGRMAGETPTLGRQLKNRESVLFP